MSLENPLTFVRSIKGAPASVLWALIFTRCAMTGRELQQWTGYADENVATATSLPRMLVWISAGSERGHWGLAEGRGSPLEADTPEPCALRALNNDDSLPIAQSLQEESLTTIAPGGQLRKAMRAAGIKDRA
jgi:hypothetical protein